MIDKYKKVSIIYGTRGKDCACKLEALINENHTKNICPIKAELLAEQYLNCDNIIQTIKEIIESSDTCIILLTFDDINNTRVRQNILIELGMAVVLLKPSQCYFFSEKKPLPDDFPSDFRHSINPNHFNPQYPEESAEQIKDYIIERLDSTSYRNIFTDDNYIFDYAKIFEKLPPSIYNLEAKTQMQQILCEWTRTLGSFDFAAERIMYFLERCIFIPLFQDDSNDQNNIPLISFFQSVYNMIRPAPEDYGPFDCTHVNVLYKLASSISEYLEDAIIQATEKKNNPNSYDPGKWSKVFFSIADDLEQTVKGIRDGKIHVNWYLYLLACDYAGLARMRAVNLGSLLQDEYEENLKTAMGMFDQAYCLAKKYCIQSASLWEGYIQFNVSRINELLYEKDRNEALLQKIRDTSQKAINARRKTILQSKHLKGIISTALTLEYFWALHREYKLEYKWPDYYEGDLNDIARKIDKALAELDVYCNATGLQKLYDVRKDLKTLLPVSEKKDQKQEQNDNH